MSLRLRGVPSEVVSVNDPFERDNPPEDQLSLL